MNSPAQRIGVAAITENLLKRKWSTVILRHLEQGINDPCEIAKMETDISPKVMSERLRTMVRYGLIARYPRPAPSSVIEYRTTILGKKILEMIDTINTLDQQLRQGWFGRRGHKDDMPDDAGLDEPSRSESVLMPRHSAATPPRRSA
jgi:DNA-binding HxlR family transcriptional regulator